MASSWFKTSSETLKQNNTPENYRVRLHNKEIDIIANIPQNFTLQLASVWDDPYSCSLVRDNGSKGLASSTGQNNPNIVGSGNPTGMLELSPLVYMNGSHMEFTIPFVLRANENPKEEILDKMKMLLKAVAPSIDKNVEGMIVRPDYSDDPLELIVGKFLKLKPVIIESVSEEFDSIFDQSGCPLSVVINVNVKSLYTITDEAIDEMFVL